MDYSHGSVYGYDQIQTYPTLNTFDNPYLDVPRILRDQQNAAAAVRSTDIRHGGDNVGYYDPIPRGYMPHAPIDSRSIVLRDEGMCGGQSLNDSNILLMLIFILLITVVINSVTLKQLSKQVEFMQNKNMFNGVILPAKP